MYWILKSSLLRNSSHCYYRVTICHCLNGHERAMICLDDEMRCVEIVLEELSIECPIIHLRFRHAPREELDKSENE